MMVQVGDRKIACTIAGRGPAVLWLHAFPVSSEIFRGQLTIPGYRHIAPDLPGFGSSRNVRPMESLEDMGCLAADLMTALGESRFSIAGVSMGGYISLAALRAARDRIDALILMDTRELADSAQARATRLEQIEQVQRDGTTPLVNAMIQKLVAPYASEELKAQVTAMMHKASADGVIAALRAMAERPDSTAQLEDNGGLRILALAGEDDVITPPSEAERMARVSGGKLARIPGAGHLACLEQVELVNAAITAFLEEVVT